MSEKIEEIDCMHEKCENKTIQDNSRRVDVHHPDTGERTHVTYLCLDHIKWLRVNSKLNQNLKEHD